MTAWSRWPSLASRVTTTSGRSSSTIAAIAASTSPASAATNDPGTASPVVPESSHPRSSTRVTPSTAAAARSSASRISPRFAGVGSPAASPAISPSSPRVAHATTDSTPRDAAWASTEPQPNASSSGWATVRSSFTGRAGEGSRGRASLQPQSARQDRVPGARAAREPSPARPPLGGSGGSRRSCSPPERS